MRVFLRRLDPAVLLRLGLGVMYLYSGTSLIRDPSEWRGFIPDWLILFVGPILSPGQFLRFQGIFELLLAFLLLAWFLPKAILRIASLVAALEIAGILFVVGVDLVTFRDIGVLAAALALTVLAWRDPRQPVTIRS